MSTNIAGGPGGPISQPGTAVGAPARRYGTGGTRQGVPNWALAALGLFIIAFVFVAVVWLSLTLHSTAVIVMALVTVLGITLMVMGTDLRWRSFIFVSVVVLMSGQLGAYTSMSSRWGAIVNTFNLEFLIAASFAIWVFADYLGQRRSYRPAPLLIVAFLLYAGAIAASFAQYLPNLEWPIISDAARAILGQPVAKDDSIFRSLSTSVMRMHILQGVLGLALLLAAHIYLDSWRKVQGYLKVMLFFAVTYAVLGIIEYIFPSQFYSAYLRIFPTAVKRVVIANMQHRVFGPFDNPPAFGVWLALFAPLAAYCVIYARNELRRLLAVGMFLLIFVAIFFTGSRMPFLAMVVAITLMTYLVGNYKVATAMTVLILLGTLWITVFGPFVAQRLPENNLLARLTAPASEKLSTIEERRKVWREALDLWNEHKVVGIGMGQWIEFREQTATRLAQLYPGQYQLTSTHSGYIQTLVEIGLAGTAIGAFLIVALLVVGLRAVKSSPPGYRRGLAAALYGSCVAMFVAGLTEPSFTLHRNFYFLASALGVITAIPVVHKREQEAEAEEQERLQWRSALTERGQRAFNPTAGR